MVDVEDKLWRNVMSWWAGIPVTGHVGMKGEEHCGLPCPPASTDHPSYDNNSVPDLKTACCCAAILS